MYPALGLFPGHPGHAGGNFGRGVLAGALAYAGFLTYLSGLCNPEYTATQYALLSSLSPLALHTIGGLSGVMAASLGFIPFFIATSFAALPAMALMLVILKFYPPGERRRAEI